MKSFKIFTILNTLILLALSQSTFAQTSHDQTPRQEKLEKRDLVNQQKQDRVDKRNPQGKGRHDSRLDRHDRRIDRKQRRTDHRVNREQEIRSSVWIIL